MDLKSMEFQITSLEKKIRYLNRLVIGLSVIVALSIGLVALREVKNANSLGAQHQTVKAGIFAGENEDGYRIAEVSAEYRPDENDHPGPRIASLYATSEKSGLRVFGREDWLDNRKEWAGHATLEVLGNSSRGVELSLEAETLNDTVRSRAELMATTDRTGLTLTDKFGNPVIKLQVRSFGDGSKSVGELVFMEPGGTELYRLPPRE